MYFLLVQNNNINNKKINDITKAFIINKNQELTVYNQQDWYSFTIPF